MIERLALGRKKSQKKESERREKKGGMGELFCLSKTGRERSRQAGKKRRGGSGVEVRGGRLGGWRRGSVVSGAWLITDRVQLILRQACVKKWLFDNLTDE